MIILAGPCLTFSLVLFANRTTTGQLTIELSSAISPVLFTFIISWFIGRVFAGALRVSLNTVLISAACDEEMFSGEQRFIEPELLSFMDGMGEEQNQQHQENKLKVRIEVGYNKNSSSVLYTRSDSAKPYFNKVLPSNNQWEDSERSHSNSRLYTPSLNVYPPSPSENHSFLEDINEASLEEEVPQYNIGYAAKYVED